MTTVHKLIRSRKIQIGFNVGLATALLVVSVFSVKHLMRKGWPLHHANFWLVAVAVILFLLAYAFKAWGWQRLFAKHERPAAGALAAAGGAACFGGIALPGRFDEAIRMAVVRRYPGTRAGLGAVGLSLIVLGMLDNAALTPMASVAAASANEWKSRAGFLVIAVAGVAAAFVVAFLPKIARARRFARFRFAGWVQEHTHCTKEAWAAWLLVSCSWLLRGTAVFLLLHALAMGNATYPLAMAFLCASAASAVVPLGPAGATAQVGAGAYLLTLSGFSKPDAVAFSLAAQAIVVVTGAAVVLLIASWHFGTRAHARARTRFALARAQA